MKFRLVLASPTETFTYNTNSDSLKIGRSSNCEFVVPKNDLSREHCLFEMFADAAFITDLGSKNGICVDRKRIEPNTRTYVTPESLIVLSNIYTLKVNNWDVKTKHDMVVEKIALHENSQTMTFELEIPQEIRIAEKKTAARRQKKEVEKEERPKNLDSIKMVVGFLAVLVFVLYQALG